MSSIFKTFADGEILTATDVNAALNPTSADHIARSVAAGTFSATFASQYRTRITTPFPGSRFTVAPIAHAHVGDVNCYITVISATATTLTLDVTRRDFNTWSGTVTGTWFAIQMTPTTAAG